MTDIASAASGDGYGGLISQMQKNDKQTDEANKGYIKKIEDIKTPEAPKLTPAPEPQQSDPLNGFGSAATWLATFGSMLTRHPLTSALNATADVMDAHKAQDATDFKRKWDKWKSETDNAWKMAEWNQGLYKDLLAKPEAEQKITASTTKNRTLEMAIQAKMQESYHKDMIRQLKQGDEAKKKLAGYVDSHVEKDRKKWEDSGKPLKDFDENAAYLKYVGEAKNIEKGQQTEDAKNETYEKWKKSPRASLIADGIAKGIPASTLIRGRGKEAEQQFEFAQDFAKERHPDLDLAEAAEDYNTAKTALRSFGTGKQGDAVRSFNVAYAHADLVGDLAKALGNGDVQKINQLSQAYEEEFGNPAPTNFDAAKSILADEINKAAVGGAGALADRQALSDNIKRSESSQQINGALGTYKNLIIGQMHGMAKQYEESTGRKDFDRFLLPEVEEDFKKGTPSKASINKNLKKYNPEEYRDAKKSGSLKKGDHFLDKDGTEHVVN